MYYNGKDMPQDIIIAVKWYRGATKQGHSEAQNTLGSMYKIGKGVHKNPIEADKWWKRTADQGNRSANYNLTRLVID